MSRFNGEQPAGIGVKWDERTFSLSQPKQSIAYADQTRDFYLSITMANYPSFVLLFLLMAGR